MKRVIISSFLALVLICSYILFNSHTSEAITNHTHKHAKIDFSSKKYQKEEKAVEKELDRINFGKLLREEIAKKGYTMQSGYITQIYSKNDIHLQIPIYLPNDRSDSTARNDIENVVDRIAKEHNLSHFTTKLDIIKMPETK